MSSDQHSSDLTMEAARAMAAGRAYTRREILARGGVAVAGLALWAACAPGDSSSNQSSTGKIRSGGVLRFGSGASSQTEGLDPVNTFIQHTTSLLFYDQLTALAPDLTVVPNLAASWNSNDELTEWTFKLRQGVKFHDGEVMKAKDVIYTYKRMLDPETGSSHAAVVAALDPNGITAVDDFTVKFTLLSPMWDFPDSAASNFVSIVPSHVPPESLATKPVGTGPFVFDEYVPGERLVAKKNPDYWGSGLPRLDEVRVSYVSDTTTRINGLKTGQFDIIEELTPLDARTIEGTPGVKVITAPSGRYVGYGMDTATKPFNDNRVRQAFKFVQNRQKTVDQVLLGVGSLANDQPIPQISPIWGDVPIPEQDVAKAKSLLAEAGYPNGIEVDLWAGDILPNVIASSQIFVEDAAEAGIRVNLHKLDVTEFVNKVYGIPAPVNFFTDPYNFRPGAANFAYGWDSQGVWNWEQWKNSDFDAALHAARGEKDPAQRAEQFALAQRIASEEGPIAIPAYHHIIEAISDKIAGYQAHPASHQRDWRQIGFTA